MLEELKRRRDDELLKAHYQFQGEDYMGAFLSRRRAADLELMIRKMVQQQTLLDKTNF